MTPVLKFTVIEIAPHDGYAVLWVSVSSSDPEIYASGTFGIQVSNEVAGKNTVGEELAF